MASKRKINSQILMDARRILQDSFRVPLLSENVVADNMCSSGVLPVVVGPEDKSSSVFLDDGIVLVGEPDLPADNVNVGDGEASRVGVEVNALPKLSSGDELEVGNVLAGAEVGFLVEASNLLPDVVPDVASREQSELGEDEDSVDDEEPRKFGDASCPSKQPFYFAPPPSESVTKRCREVSRHDVAFISGKPRLMAMWEGEQHLVFGIGGHLRTVIDWFEARKRDEASVSQWEPVADPARPDVPLYIEFTAVFGEEEVPAGTVIKEEDKALVPWLFMCNSSRVGREVNTQFFWCSSGPPVGFWTSVPIVCRVTVDQIPVETPLFFDVDAVRKQYAWSDAAREFARDCIARLDAGEDPFIAQYLIERSRAVGLSWAYGGTPAELSQYGEVGQGGPPHAREIVKARGRGVLKGRKKASSSSADVRNVDVPQVNTVQRRGVGGEKSGALWLRAFDPVTLVPLDQYAMSSMFEDPGDKRTAQTKYNWWGVYLAQRRERGLYVPSVFEDRLDRYLKTMTRSANRRKHKDSRRESRAAAKGGVVDLVSDRSDREDDDGSGGSGGGVSGAKRKRRGTRSGSARSKSSSAKARKVDGEADSDESARSRSRGTQARKVDADSDSDAIPRYLRPDRVGRPLADYAPGYEMVAHKIQKDAMRAIGTVWGPEGRLHCLGSAAIFNKEDLAMGSDYEVDGTRMGEHVVASPRTKALQAEEILVGLRNTLSEGIERLRWLIDYGYNSNIVPNGRREKPPSRR
jgi:hypothetical protein